MKRQISIFLHLFLLLALSSCGVIPASPSPMPSPSATTKPSRLPDQDVVPGLLVGSHNYSPSLVAVVVLESILFILIGLWRFSREEF